MTISFLVSAKLYGLKIFFVYLKTVCATKSFYLQEDSHSVFVVPVRQFTFSYIAW